MKIIKIIILTILPMYFALAQQEMVDLKLSPTCSNANSSSFQIDLFIKANAINSAIRVAEQNYRFTYNTAALQNPRIFEEATEFNGLVIEGNQVSAYAKHHLQGSLSNTISYNVELEGGVGTLLHKNQWTKVGTIEFDVINENAAKEFTWLGLDQFPTTVIYNLVGAEKQLLQPNFWETGSLYQDAEVIQAINRTWQHPTCGLQNGQLQLSWVDFPTVETIQVSIDGGATFSAIPEVQQSFSVQNLSGGDYDIRIKLGADETTCAIQLDDVNLRTEAPAKDGLRAVYTCSDDKLRLKELDYDAEFYQFRYRTYNGLAWSAWHNSTLTTNGLKDITDLPANTKNVQYRVRLRCNKYWSSWSAAKIYALPACRLNGSEISNQLTVYPNPFSDALRVDFESEIDASAQIQITDLIGKTIYKESVQFMAGNNSHQIELDANLSNGVYMISIWLGDQPVQTVKMIKD